MGENKIFKQNNRLFRAVLNKKKPQFNFYNFGRFCEVYVHLRPQLFMRRIYCNVNGAYGSEECEYAGMQEKERKKLENSESGKKTTNKQTHKQKTR